MIYIGFKIMRDNSINKLKYNKPNSNFIKRYFFIANFIFIQILLKDKKWIYNQLVDESI